jgi:hypothetical protein
MSSEGKEEKKFTRFRFTCITAGFIFTYILHEDAGKGVDQERGGIQQMICVHDQKVTP